MDKKATTVSSQSTTNKNQNLNSQPKLNAIETEDPLLEKKQKTGLIIGAVIIIAAGILSGYFLSQSNKLKTVSGGGEVVNTDKVVGSTNTQEYPDSAEGTLEAGGIDGEGTHKLLRPGGESQTVYLTSSVVDLDQFVGKEVKVFGETHAAKSAGWFMDVGRVEVK